MAKLSEAQRKELERIRRDYNPEKSLKFWLDVREKEGDKDYILREIENTQKGFVCWRSLNSKTLEKLAECGYIEYIKCDDRANTSPIDRIKLIK